MDIYRYFITSSGFTNASGFTIGVIGLTYNGGLPKVYKQTGSGGALLISGACAYVIYYTTKDEIKVIKARKKGLYLY